MQVPLAGVMFVLLIAGLIYAEGAGSGAWTLSHFTAYVASAVRQNLPLGSSLSAYAQDLPGKSFRKRRVLLDIADTVDNGLFLADALDRHPAVFPGYYRALVRAGENGGNLARVLDRLAETAELDLRTAKRAAGYAFYPATLALIALGILWAGLSAGVSRLLNVYGTFGGQSGGGSVAGVVEPARWILLLVLVVCGGIAMLPMVGLGIFRRVGRTVPVLARAWSWFAWHVPVVGRYERRRAVSQYALAAGRLLEAGVPTREALDMAAGASGNTHLDRMTRAAAGRVGEGAKLSHAIAAADRRGELPGEFLWHVEAGEASGRLPEALARAAESLSVRSRSALAHLVRFVFPAGVVLVALAVGVLVYAIVGTVSTMQLQMSRAPWRTQGKVRTTVPVRPRTPPPPRRRRTRRVRPPVGRGPVRRPVRPPARRPAPPPVRE